MKNLTEELKKHIEGDVLDDPETLEKNSRDASIFKVEPKVVVCPKNEQDVMHLINFVNKNKGLSLTGRAAGTDMSGGPLTQSIVVSFTKYMNQIKHLDKNKATVEPGLYYRDLEKEMDKRNIMYPSYPASKSLCAMGGIISNNSGGEKSLVYGQTVNHVLRLNMALADGKIHEFKPLNKAQLNEKMKKTDFEGHIYREMYNLCEKNYDLIKEAEPKASKNSCGYFLWKVWDRKTFDLTKLFVGSQGTLGLWMDADVRLVKKTKYTRLVAVTLEDLKQISPVIETVKSYNPESLESFDNHTLKLGLKFMPEIANKIHKNVFSFMWEFRKEAWEALIYGFPIFIVLVELSGDKEKQLQAKADKLGRELSSKKIHNIVMQSEREGEKYWVMRRESFNLLRQKVKDKTATPFVDDFAVQPQYLSEFLPQLYKLLEKHGIQPTLAGHVGDGNFHIIPLMDLKKSSERNKIPIVLDKFTKLVAKYHGTITAEHNDGLIRTPFLSRQYSPKIISLFERVKEIFDKDNIFNPGKKVHGSLSFTLSHIKAK
jgi:FAD/FMN-containing dehydrogenase